MSSLPKEIWRMIFYYCGKEEQYSLSQTNKYLHSLKYKKPRRYYCFWRNGNRETTKHGEYGSKYVYFYHIEDCLKYCNKIKYEDHSLNNKNKAHYLEIGKAKHSTKHSTKYLKRTKLASFSFIQDNECNY